MCGQLGLILGRKERTPTELSFFRKLFSYLLILNEERGPHATGVAWIKRDGQHRILKGPQRASEFLRDDAYRGILAGFDSAVTWLAGHTRWQTVGDASNNLNNHPIRAGEVIGTHNGTILNADTLFSRFGLPRAAQVDSELIFRIADSTLKEGQVDIPAFKAQLGACKGGISAVLASRLSPEKVIVLKGNRPLEIRYSATHRVIAYSSEARHMNTVLALERAWKPVDLRMMTMAIVRCDCLEASSCETFTISSPYRDGYLSI